MKKLSCVVLLNLAFSWSAHVTEYLCKVADQRIINGEELTISVNEFNITTYDSLGSYEITQGSLIDEKFVGLDNNLYFEMKSVSSAKFYDLGNKLGLLTANDEQAQEVTLNCKNLF